MRVTGLSKYNITYCDEYGDLVREGVWEQEDHDNWERSDNRHWNELRHRDVALIQQYQVEKPDWFTSAERSARKFIKGLGLLSARGTQITLADVTDATDAKKIFGDTDELMVDAHHTEAYGVLVRNSHAEAAYNTYGKVAVARTIVHELVHASQRPSRSAIKYYEGDDEWTLIHRNGYRLLAGKKKFGNFYIEGIAEFAAALYLRRQQQANPAITSITSTPSLELPVHYTGMQPVKPIPYTVGPDGYGIELLAWGAEQKDVTTAENFIDTMLSAYSLDDSERLRGLRGFARNTNAIQPGLYTALRELEYGRENWLTGLKIVHEAVTN